ncbi:MAG: metallophosphoesterase [Acidobacteria bacterium]|nr:metallophosphoesterase [Acidobacteriota bacterium]
MENLQDTKVIKKAHWKEAFTEFVKLLWHPAPTWQKKMVRWYSPKQLLRTASEVFISSILGRHADRRSIEASNRPPKYFDFSGIKDDALPPAPKEGYRITREARKIVLPTESNALWIDYVSDLGDGWDSTFAIANQLSQERFPIKLPNGDVESLHRGNILIFGGDEVYPTAVREEYQNRLVIPYQMAFSQIPTNQPFLFALPGNHDWYDSLSAFIEFFGDYEKSDFADGRWCAPQNRSYFALQLPHGWWIFGIDVQLQSDLDYWQFKYFKKIVEERMQPGDRVVFCCAEPYWMYNKMFASSQKKYEKSNLKMLVDFIDPHNELNETDNSIPDKSKHIAVFLAGDLHHYYRVWNRKNNDLNITAGGGGAFLHPTHGAAGKAFRGKEYSTSCYPEKSTSWLLGLKNIFFLPYNPTFGIITGVLYVLFAWFFVASLGESGFSRILTKRGDLLTLQTPLLIASLYNPFLSFLIFAIMLGFILFTYTEHNNPIFRWIGGSLHGLGHIVAALFTCVLGYATYLSVKPADATDVFHQLPAMAFAALVIFLGGWAVGSCLVGIYLLISLNVFGQHTTAAFSSLRIEGWKNFLRLKLDLETGTLTIYPIGIRRPPHRKEWEMQFSSRPDLPDHFALKNGGQIEAELIDGPIELTPVKHGKNGLEVSFP